MGNETGQLLSAVENVRVQLGAATFPLDAEGTAQARTDIARLTAQLDDYILPRLRDAHAPLLAVVGGSTGSGKSTLVNSIVGEKVTESGVLRPTTRTSILIHHPTDNQWFTGPRILPTLARTTGTTPTNDPNSIHLTTNTTIPAGIAILDAPDIDSIVEANRDLSRQLLAAADLWLFVTTAARYADAVPWEMLDEAVERGTSIAIVLDRVPPGAEETIGEHLAAMLIEHGLRHSPIFTISEVPLDNGLLPLFQTQQLREWLNGLGSDARARSLLIRQTLTGALDSLDTRIKTVAETYSMQVQTKQQLDAMITSAYGAALQRITIALSDGSLLRGEILARWHEFVGTGEFLKTVEISFGRLRDRVTAAITGKPTPATELGEALRSGVAELLLSHAALAREDLTTRWDTIPAGTHLINTNPNLHRPNPNLEDKTNRLIRDWQNDILELVRAEGKDRRTTARILAIGTNTIGFILMLVLFSQTGGLTGGEIGIAGGSSVLAQRLLEAVFGDQAVRTLATKARKLLMQRCQTLLSEEENDIRSTLNTIELDPQLPRRLADALATVKASR
ncbi:GTPase domain-containing protein [Dermatophilus congolensis]|uniref:GTPase domain-containing protein n=1 Tax=Dermatophilus congolensis TaxID=1863 RepID=UPI000426CDDE|nr:GTPase domain-containing protein [Dermatophilus congolensis]MBO3129122.1 GTPase domain-containing protein [Dermatophilus congolensis]MBO3132241.1 GTPase domain-containing protein [Dermatophilus congolensis]MBO3133598.1 GTPase domain-containing protein [Dermatophilus congolensis]MBO3135831.1 GTPase domain-containing protein [Dermatophilus congolensis]MBO3138074.1 GTPase domain-containing protein [Dermatophilus congolensis]